MATLLTGAISDVRSTMAEPIGANFSVAAFLEDARLTASLYERTTGCTLKVAAVDRALMVNGNRELLAAALVNLLQNAFKFTAAGSEITLDAHRVDDRVLIEVHDHCGGLTVGASDLFKPFRQAGVDRSGLGLGLTIARRSVEADGGTLRVTDLPGLGCIFTIALPLSARARH